MKGRSFQNRDAATATVGMNGDLIFLPFPKKLIQKDSSLLIHLISQ